ncbi:MAG: hypothetical protein M3Y13_10020 [Armatimonadota bacterium]|nr:hypothetical protein [Armatimonadota bacterium]
MRLDLWLAQPETEAKLGAARRLVMVAVALWGVAVAYGVWNTHSALTAAQLEMIAQGQQISEVARTLPQKRREAAKAAQVRLIAPESGGGADIFHDLASLAQSAGVDVQGIHRGDGKDQTFECSLAGDYPALTRFLNRLAASPQPFAIASLQVTTLKVEQSGDPLLELKLIGRVSGMPAKP